MASQDVSCRFEKPSPFLKWRCHEIANLSGDMGMKKSKIFKWAIIAFVLMPIFCCLVYLVNRTIINIAQEHTYCKHLTPGMSPESVEAYLRQVGSFTLLYETSFSDVRHKGSSVVWIKYDNPIMDYISEGEIGFRFRDGKYSHASIPKRFGEPASRPICR